MKDLARFFIVNYQRTYTQSKNFLKINKNFLQFHNMEYYPYKVALNPQGKSLTRGINMIGTFLKGMVAGAVTLGVVAWLAVVLDQADKKKDADVKEV